MEGIRWHLRTESQGFITVHGVIRLWSQEALTRGWEATQGGATESISISTWTQQQHLKATASDLEIADFQEESEIKEH